MAIGDSITFGLGDGGSGSCSVLDPQFNGFCPRLASARRKAVINEGVCGDDSYGGVTRLPAVLERWRPSSLLVLFSPNDLPHPMSEVVENLRTMVRFARERGVVPVLGTLTPVSGPHRSWEPFILALNDRIRRLAQEERIALADHYRAFLGDPSFRGRTGLFLNPDGLHPTARGYGLMAQTWDRALRRGWEPVPVRRPDGLGEDGSAVGPEMRPAAEPSSGY